MQNIGLHGYSERRANYERVNRYLYKIPDIVQKKRFRNFPVTVCLISISDERMCGRFLGESVSQTASVPGSGRESIHPVITEQKNPGGRNSGVFRVSFEFLHHSYLTVA